MTTKYILVKETIKSWILEGEVVPHQKIYSEHELAEKFHVSRHTIRQAIGELVHEGWLYREQGRGTFCAGRNRNSGKLIGMITTYISDYIFPSIIRGAESYLNSKGYTLLLASTNNNPVEEKACLQNILSKNVDGLIVEPTKSAIRNPNLDYYFTLETKKIPYVMINAFYPELHPPSLTVNDTLGGYLATEHLIQLGHRRIIGFFKTDDLQGVNRMQGFVQAHRENRLPVSPGMIVSFNTEEKYVKPKEELAKILKTSKHRPTAIVCYNDEITLSILDVVRDLQLKVPDDISIVGYDDSHLAEASEVKLTTIKHPKAMMGEMAAKKIVDAIEKNQQGTTGISSFIYEPELVIRKSTQSVSKTDISPSPN
ncbi:GntR family transcriptional regulator [Paenactinomyces guangxiensis]|uniref:GntR family transcriptional regulator n=1 Tax=Paenactinomyces guangxiensis TaxID=1490290 RepID=A0A7W1WNK8_9BACL|nr:GntR family transcriptional regulator [Paenactinomyces guangxiensis]MBA4493034.1 GntR family transcriptional regulator [Paenactinomyces guangxiensis]MBH8590117.1 GntR family transcriptional regulator [Paenactinomyces guangxiensis]